MKAALLNSKNQVIGEVFNAPDRGNEIVVAGCFTVNGDPVNCKTYKISRSKKNLAAAAYQQPVSKNGDVYTFHSAD